MIARFEKFEPGALMQMPHHLRRKIRMPIQSRAHCRSAERELTQNLDRLFGARFSICPLLGVTGEFLAQPYRRGIHQMSAADLDDVVKFFRLARKRTP